MNGNWFDSLVYGSFSKGLKVARSSSPENRPQMIITQSKDFTKKGIVKIRKSVQAYDYLIPTS